MKASNPFSYYGQPSNSYLHYGQPYQQTNPFEFTFNGARAKIKFSKIEAKNSRVNNPVTGQQLLKCTYIVYFRSHDGYSSEVDDYDQVGYELETQKLVCLYFTIPSELTDESGSLNPDLLDNEGNLLNNEHTQQYFIKWSNESACCGVCGYTDLYVPQYIEWVKIV